MSAPSPFAAVSSVIHGRRTHKLFAGTPIERPVIEELLELARWAPTHRLSEPWRFVVLDRPAIARLMDYIRAQPAIAAFPDPEKGAAKVAKLLERLPTVGALLMTTWVRQSVPAIDLEDHSAAAAAVQNLLLGATALGLASYWSTNPALCHPLTQRWCGIDSEREGVIGSIWLGGLVETPKAPPRRPLTERVRWL